MNRFNKPTPRKVFVIQTPQGCRTGSHIQDVLNQYPDPAWQFTSFKGSSMGPTAVMEQNLAWSFGMDVNSQSSFDNQFICQPVAGTFESEPREIQGPSFTDFHRKYNAPIYSMRRARGIK